MIPAPDDRATDRAPLAAPDSPKIPADEVRNVLVPKAFYAILAEEGKPPTVDRIIDWLVRQGYSKPNRNVVSAANQACFAELGKRLRQPLHAQLPEETVGLVYALRDNMLGLAKQELAEEAEAIRAQARRDVEAARAGQAEAEQSRHEARRELDKALEVRVQQERLIAELQAAQQTAKDDIAALRARATHAEGELEMSRRAVQGLEAAAHAREREHADALTKLQDQLDAERARADADHRHGLLAIEAERMETKLARKTTADALAKIDALNERERERVAEMAVLKSQLASEQLTRRQLQEAGAKQIAGAEAAVALARDAASVAQAAEASARGMLQAVTAERDALQARLAGFGSLTPHSLADLIARAMLQAAEGTLSAAFAPADPAARQRAAVVAAQALLAPFDVSVPVASPAPEAMGRPAAKAPRGKA